MMKKFVFSFLSYSLRSTEIVHSPIKAAIAPTAASMGEITAPTTPMVSGKTTKSFPFLSLIVIFLTFPSLMISLIFLINFPR